MNDLLQEIINAMDGATVESFLRQVLKNYKFLDASGCYSEDTNETIRTNIALRLTGKNIRFASAKGTIALDNAKHFI